MSSSIWAKIENGGESEGEKEKAENPGQPDQCYTYLHPTKTRIYKGLRVILMSGHCLTSLRIHISTHHSNEGI